MDSGVRREAKIIALIKKTINLPERYWFIKDGVTYVVLGSSAKYATDYDLKWGGWIDVP